MAITQLSLNEAKSILTTPQTVTNAWVNLGNMIPTGDAEELALWIDLDINSSSDVQIRVLGYEDSTSVTPYVLTAATVGETSIAMIDQAYTLGTEDKKFIVPVVLPQTVPYCQLQVKAGTVGATGADIESLKVSYKPK